MDVAAMMQVMMAVIKEVKAFMSGMQATIHEIREEATTARQTAALIRIEVDALKESAVTKSDVRQLVQDEIASCTSVLWRTPVSDSFGVC